MIRLCFAHTNGNSFIIVDALEHSLLQEELRALHALLIQENRDDLLILTDKKIEGHGLIATMQVFGQDGTFAEFCGNGSLAVAAFLQTCYPQFQRFALTTKHGVYPLGTYSILLPLPSQLINPVFIKDGGKVCQEEGWTYVEMLEPHLVTNKPYTKEELLMAGKRLNALSSVFPYGINLNAYFFTEEGDCHVITYERGVQRLTSACGSGSICCLAAAHAQGEITVITPGGSLFITLHPQGVELKGTSIIEKIFFKKLLYDT